MATSSRRTFHERVQGGLLLAFRPSVVKQECPSPYTEDGQPGGSHCLNSLWWSRTLGNPTIRRPEPLQYMPAGGKGCGLAALRPEVTPGLLLLEASNGKLTTKKTGVNRSSLKQ
jgi:hypothetical protein